MRCISCVLVLIGLVTIAHGDEDPKAKFVEEQIRYLRLLETAEQLLESGQSDRALATLEQALRCEFPESHVPHLKLDTQGAAAHYLVACVHAQAGSPDAALESLSRAAKNGFRNTAYLKADARLQTLSGHPDYAAALAAFPKHKLTDRFAGKLVADAKFGIAMQKHRLGNVPRLGEPAPDFELPLFDRDEATFRLSSFQGKRPVVVIFGSFT